MTSRRGAEPGLSLVALAAALWALIGLFTPALLDAGLSVVQIAFWRAALGGVCFVVHAVVRAGGGALGVAGWRDTAGLVGFGVVAVGLFYVALARAIELGGVSLAWILLYTAPAWVAVAAVTLLRERVDLVRWLLVGATILGVVLVAVGGGDGVRVTVASLAWGLVSGMSYAAWYVGGKRFLGRYSPVTVSAWILVVGAVVLAPAGWVWTMPARTWLLLAGLGVVSTYLPALAYYSGLRRVEASRAAIVATIEPVIAVAVAVVVEHERPTALALVGGAIVLAAAAIAAARR